MQTLLSIGHSDRVDAAPAPPIRAAVICDFAEEHWPSMDVVADMLLAYLEAHAESVAAARICPRMQLRFRWRSLDRAVNRFYDYPRELRRYAAGFDVYHVIDHSYAHLVHTLPPARTVVTCHDLDAFRCLLQPAAEPRGLLYRRMSRRILSGLARAARVICVSRATRDEILRHGLVAPQRLSVVPNGIHPAFSAAPDAGAEAELLRLAPSHLRGCAWLLHVGSSAPRKRLDVLLQVFARVRRQLPQTALLRVGSFTPAQQELARGLALEPHVWVVPRLDLRLLAAAYRRAALVLQPSEREGFGLPVAEAQACGAVVTASDIPALRETGGAAAVYCAAAAEEEWAQTIIRLLVEQQTNASAWTARRLQAVRQAAGFSWRTHAAAVAEIYRNLLGNLSCID